MERDAERLYELIWRQFVACQMPAAEYTATTVTAAAGDYELNVKGRVVRFDGFTRVQPPASRKGDDAVLPDMKEGDALSLSIAAASVVAKVTRDREMKALAEAHPVYGFERHKGYGTRAHLEALREHGPCPAHRMSFKPVSQMELF